MLAKLDSHFIEIGMEGAIEIGDRNMFVVLSADWTGILLIWFALRLFSLDEQIAGSSVNVKVVGHSLDHHLHGEEVTHGSDSVSLGVDSQMQGVLVVLKLQISEVVVNNVACSMLLLKMVGLGRRAMVNGKSLHLMAHWRQQ